MSPFKRQYLPWFIGIAALCGVAFLTLSYVNERSRNAELSLRNEELSRMQQRSAILQSISSQMEEIAYQQKAVSDQKREEAQQQSHIAELMRKQAEEERRSALEAEKAALASEQKAIEASVQAEKARENAEAQREEAEKARAVADTLSYLALARSLSSAATLQENAGNHALACLLVTAAYEYTTRYNGDVYQPVLFEALTKTSHGSVTWAIHNGSIIKLSWLDGGKGAVTISTYGEIARHSIGEDGLKTEMLFSDSRFDFRDQVLQKDGGVYAISRSGHIVYISPSRVVSVRPLPGLENPFRLFTDNGGGFIAVGENAVAILDGVSLSEKSILSLDRRINIVGTIGWDAFLLFGEPGKMLRLPADARSFVEEKLPFDDEVFSYTWVKNGGISLYGTTAGPIVMVTPDGRISRLVGHRSRVARLFSVANHVENVSKDLFLSTSYDGTVKMWDPFSEKIEPINVMTSDTWVVSCAIDPSGNYIWTGDQNGALTRTIISASMMAAKVRSSLSREFTRDEWNYYIGAGIPYETYRK